MQSRSCMHDARQNFAAPNVIKEYNAGKIHLFMCVRDLLFCCSQTHSANVDTRGSLATTVSTQKHNRCYAI